MSSVDSLISRLALCAGGLFSRGGGTESPRRTESVPKSKKEHTREGTGSHSLPSRPMSAPGGGVVGGGVPVGDAEFVELLNIYSRGRSNHV